MVLSRETQIFTGVILGVYFDAAFVSCRKCLKETQRKLEPERNRISSLRGYEQSKGLDCDGCNGGIYIP